MCTFGNSFVMLSQDWRTCGSSCEIVPHEGQVAKQSQHLRQLVQRIGGRLTNKGYHDKSRGASHGRPKGGERAGDRRIG